MRLSFHTQPNGTNRLGSLWSHLFKLRLTSQRSTLDLEFTYFARALAQSEWGHSC